MVDGVHASGAAAALPRLLAGRYQLERRVAKGGSSALYRAFDRTRDCTVAVKLLSRDTLSDAPRFLTEASIARSLVHPHIVRALDAQVTSEGDAFLVMELLEGESLAGRLGRGGPLTPSALLELLLPIMGAVAFAHDRGVLHRDIKPENIFLAKTASGAIVPKLLDFGVAKSLDASGQTRSGIVVGTPSYMSPEQALAEHLTVTSDIWSLGVVAFQALSGRLPFEADSVTSLLIKIADGHSPSLSKVAPTLPRRLTLAIDRALKREPSSRYVDVRSFARALHDTAHQEQIALPSEPDRVGLSDWSVWRRAAAEPTRLEDRAIVSATPASSSSEGAEIAVRYRTDHSIVASVGNVIVTWMGGAIDPGATAAAFEHTHWLCARFPQGIGRIVIVDHAVRMPTPAERLIIQRQTQTYAAHTRAHVVVLRGNGLWMTTSRVLARAMMLAIRTPLELFENPDRAASWLHKRCQPHSAFEPHELQAWIREHCPLR